MKTDDHQPAATSSPERSHRPRGARGARQGADRGGEAAREAAPPEVRGVRRRRLTCRGRDHDDPRAEHRRGERIARAGLTVERRGRHEPRRSPSSLARGRTVRIRRYAPGYRPGTVLTGKLYTVNADGSGLRLVAQKASIAAPPAWSPDGAEAPLQRPGGIQRRQRRRQRAAEPHEAAGGQPGRPTGRRSRSTASSRSRPCLPSRIST